MLSRAAENLYWIGRYVERAENVARLLDVAFHFELDASTLREETGGRPTTETVLQILGCRDAYHTAIGPDAPDRDRALRFLSFDPTGHHSILVMTGRARENARASRDALSADSWNQLNRLYLYLTGPKAEGALENSPLRFFDRVKRDCILFAGLVESTLPRTAPFHFLQLGRHLERVHQIGRILQIQLPNLQWEASESAASWNVVHWSNLLRCCSANESYLQASRDRVEPKAVVEFLVLNPDFPRSIQLCVARLWESLQAIRGSSEDPFGEETDRLLGRLDSSLRYADLNEIFASGPADFLVSILQASNRIGDEIHQAYFHSY